MERREFLRQAAVGAAGLMLPDTEKEVVDTRLTQKVTCAFKGTALSDLCEKLKRAFARSKIGQMQSEIGVDDSDQRYIREMKTLGDHLRADEDVDLTRAKISQRFAIRFLARH